MPPAIALAGERLSAGQRYRKSALGSSPAGTARSGPGGSFAKVELESIDAIKRLRNLGRRQRLRSERTVERRRDGIELRALEHRDAARHEVLGPPLLLGGLDIARLKIGPANMRRGDAGLLLQFRQDVAGQQGQHEIIIIVIVADDISEAPRANSWCSGHRRGPCAISLASRDHRYPATLCPATFCLARPISMK
jgi:hypothetical protein